MYTKYLKTAAMLLSLAVIAHPFAKASHVDDEQSEARYSVAQVLILLRNSNQFASSIPISKDHISLGVYVAFG